MFYIVFHESKHGIDYTSHTTLQEAIKDANELTQKYYKDYATNYKEVKNEGCYDDIYIKELNISTTSLSTKELNTILHLVVNNSHALKTSDNEIDLTKYPSLQKLLQTNNWKLKEGLSNYAKSYMVVDENDEPVRISTKYENVELKEFSTAVNSAPDSYQKFIAKKIEYPRDVNKDLKEMDEWISKWIQEPFKIHKYDNDTKKDITVLFQ